MNNIKEDDDMYLVKEDTPIEKATLLDLDLDKQRKFIEKLQERRLRVHEVSVRAKRGAKIAKEKNKLPTANKIENLDEKLMKLIEKIDKDLIRAEKIADEIKVYRMTLGDFDES